MVDQGLPAALARTPYRRRVLVSVVSLCVFLVVIGYFEITSTWMPLRHGGVSSSRTVRVVKDDPVRGEVNGPGEHLRPNAPAGVPSQPPVKQKREEGNAEPPKVRPGTEQRPQPVLAPPPSPNGSGPAQRKPHPGASPAHPPPVQGAKNAPAKPPRPPPSKLPPTQPPKKPTASLAYIVHNLIERDDILDWTLAQFAAYLPTWPVQVFVGNHVEAQVRRLPTVRKLSAEKRLSVIKVPVRDTYRYPWESMLLTEQLWRQVEGEKVLVFAPSSVICDRPKERLGDFMQYDFVGAFGGDRKNPNRFASGWTSLRTPQKMIEILKKFPIDWSAVTREDGYFREYMGQVGGKIAPESVDRLFASGREATPGSLFWSAAGVFFGPISDEMRRHCPGVDIYMRRTVGSPAKGPRVAKNVPSYDDFIAASRKIRRRAGAPAYDFGVLIVQIEPVPAHAVERVMRSVMANVDLTKWKFQIAAGPKLMASLRARAPFNKLIEEGAIATMNLQIDSGRYPDVYNHMLFGRNFWEQIVFEKFLLFHTDSVMCSHSPYRLEDFVRLDYAGAPWSHFPRGIQVGNGGSSWRSRSKHLAVIDKFKPLQRFPHENEDQIFPTFLPEVGGVVADEHSAGNFACENIQTLHCLVLHAPEKNNFGQERELRQYCPEAIPWLGSRGQ